MASRYEVRHPEMAKLLRTKILVFIDPDKQASPTSFECVRCCT